MKKASPIIALLLSFAIVFGMFTLCFADTAQGENEITQTSVTDPADTLSLMKSNAPDGIEAEEEDESGEDDQNDSDEPEEGASSAEEEQQSSSKRFSLGGLIAALNPSRILYDEGIHTLTTHEFVKIVDALRFVRYVLTGKIITGAPKKFDATFDDDLIMVCKAISDQSSLDVYELLTNLPDVNDPAKIAAKVFNIDVGAYREKMYEARENYYHEGNAAMANICWALGAYMSGIESAYVHLEPKDTYHEVVLDVQYSDGTMEIFHPNIYIDLETGECFGNKDRGMMEIGFNTNAYDALVYAPMYCWMKDFGFCVEYDMLCYVLPVYCYNTRRFKFDYGDKEWMIQIWKGNYLITNGGEVGIYNRDKGSFGTFYNVVEEENEMNMSLLITHGDDVLVDMQEQRHWWINGFKLGKRLYSPHSLDMTFTIEMPDEEMLSAFTKSIDKNFFHDVYYSVEGLKVTAHWDT